MGPRSSHSCGRCGWVGGEKGAGVGAHAHRRGRGEHLRQGARGVVLAAHDARDGAGLAALGVAVKHAEALPVEVGGAVREEDGVHVGRVRRSERCGWREEEPEQAPS